MRVIVNNALSLIIMHIPKCAGKSLRQAFAPEDPSGKFWHWKYSQANFSWQDMAHIPLDQLRGFPEWDLLEKYTVIAVVRNPVDRFYSALSEHRAQHNKKDMSDIDILKNVDLLHIHHDPQYIHFMPQYRFTHLGNKQKVDYIARQENLRDDLLYIGQKAGFGKAYFDAVMRLEEFSAGEKSASESREEYSEFIAKLYARDFLLFHYPFPAGFDKNFIETYEQMEFPYGDISWLYQNADEYVVDRISNFKTLYSEHGELLRKLESHGHENDALREQVASLAEQLEAACVINMKLQQAHDQLHSACEEKISASECAYKELESVHRELEAVHSDLVEKHNMISTRLNIVENSLSLKVTKPLRWVKKIIS
jgi:hypothetical protein